MRKLPRRAFLSGVAGSTIALPWLEAMGPVKNAHGQAGKPPLRFVAFVTSEGVFPERFWPRLTGEPMFPLDKPPSQDYLGGKLADETVQAADSTDYIFSPGLEPLARHRQDLLIIEGLDSSGGPGHDQWPSVLTGRSGRATGISLDQAIANHIAGDTKFKSLQLGCKTDNGIPFIAYGPDQPALVENNPQTVFDRVFAEVAPPDTTAIDRLRAERKSVLDATMAEITDLQAVLGQADKAKLQNYLDSVREVEQRLDKAGSGQSCGRPQLVTAPEDNWWNDDDNLPLVLDAQFDMLSMALACDLTRVASVSFANNNSDITLPAIGINQGFHSQGHEPDSNMDAQNRIAKLDAWKAEQLAKLIDRLKAIPEGNGTVFDNTVILWVHELTKGNSHRVDNMPHVLAGSAQGYLKVGRYLRLPRLGPQGRGYRLGRWSNDLKVTVLNAFGVADGKFGDENECDGPIDVLRA
jgi:hypothetical protein